MRWLPVTKRVAGVSGKTRLRMSPVTQRLVETWARGVKAMENILDETTLADLCKPEAGALMYYI